MGNEKILIVDGNFVSLRTSLKVKNHSPTGFSWGYFGSGPSQTALAILLECVDKKTALTHYQQYKEEVISKVPQEQEVLVVSKESVQEWLREREIKQNLLTVYYKGDKELL